MSFASSAAVMGVVGLVGSGISAYGQYQKGVEQKKAGEEQRQAFEFNAALSRQRAEAEAQREALNEFKKRKLISEAIGTQVAGYAASGVVTTTGSPIDVLTDSLANAKLDIAIDRYNSEIARRGLMSEAAMKEEEGIMAEEAGEAAYKEGIIGAVGTLAKGAASASTKFGGGTKIGSGGGSDFPSGYSGSGAGQE